MPKAYTVVSYHSISDLQKLAAYAKLAPAATAPFGARYLARGTAAAAFSTPSLRRTPALGLKRVSGHGDGL